MIKLSDFYSWLKSLFTPKKETNKMADEIASTTAEAQAVQEAVDKVNPTYYTSEDVEKIFDVAKYAADKLGVAVFAPVIQHLKSLITPASIDSETPKGG